MRIYIPSTYLMHCNLYELHGACKSRVSTIQSLSGRIPIILYLILLYFKYYLIPRRRVRQSLQGRVRQPARVGGIILLYYYIRTLKIVI